MIALAIAGVLACMAVPTYRSYVLRANRTDARAALLALAAAQEKYYLQCNRYTASLDDSRVTDCSTSNLRFPASSERGLYTLTVTAADASSWSATATVASGTPQAADRRCYALALDSAGARTSLAAGGGPGDESCWTK